MQILKNEKKNLQKWREKKYTKYNTRKVGGAFMLVERKG